MTLAHDVSERKEVSEVLALAAASGGKFTKPAHEVFWGHSGYFTDLDGHLWNQQFLLDACPNHVPSRIDRDSV